MRNVIKIIALILSSVFLFSCETITFGGGTSGGHHDHHPATKKGGPPAHAPAHGYRKKFGYKYYPSKKVYYCSQRRIYFWMEGNGWRLGTSLPAGLTVDASESISLDIDEETPYRHYESNYKSSHPGKGKGKDKSSHPGKGKAKGKYK